MPLKLRSGQEPALSAWLAGIKADWVTEQDQEGARAQITVKDVDRARSELLQLLGRSELPVLRFELSTPDLEDVFLQLVTKNGGAK